MRLFQSFPHKRIKDCVYLTYNIFFFSNCNTTLCKVLHTSCDQIVNYLLSVLLNKEIHDHHECVLKEKEKKKEKKKNLKKTSFFVEKV